MLVLTRKIQEAVQIGDDIEITVLAIEGDQVKLGISAPKSVEIHRKEVYQEILKQNNQAANFEFDIFSLLDKNDEK